MWGAIIGDIVGSRFEFDNYKKKDFEFFTEESILTDDTVMTIAVAKALKDAKDKPIEDLKKQTILQMCYFANKYPSAGYGTGFYRFLFYRPVPYNSFGNGAAMRISRVGEVCDSIEEVKKISKAVTEISHSHSEGIKGAECVAVCIYLARQGKTKEEIKRYVVDNYYPEIEEMTCDNIRPNYYFNETCQGTVPQALICFFEGNNYEDVIRNAISIGGDSDTIGAIAGSIAEAFFGVPKEMIEYVRKNCLPDDLLKSIDDILGE